MSLVKTWTKSRVLLAADRCAAPVGRKTTRVIEESIMLSLSSYSYTNNESMKRLPNQVKESQGKLIQDITKITHGAREIYYEWRVAVIDLPDPGNPRIDGPNFARRWKVRSQY